jgi:plastocyanin
MRFTPIMMRLGCALLLVGWAAACTDASAKDAGATPSDGTRDGAMRDSGGGGMPKRDGGGGGGAGDDAATAVDAGGCDKPSDCPSPSEADPCMVPTCVKGVCGVARAAADSKVADATPGDCQATVCDAKGKASSSVDDGDVPADDGNACTEEACNEGAPSHTPKASGTTCMQDGGNFCDAAGGCVECTLANQCASNVCQDGTCRAAVCGNGMLDTGETDTDCGGDCGGCGPNQACLINGDCAGMDCTASVCVANCADGVKNNTESDIDCGASCTGKPCADGAGCATDDDCEHAFCNPTNDRCKTPSCEDGLKNGTETAIDCGGTTNGVTCPVCCSTNEDCDSVSGTGKGLCDDGRCVDDVNGCTLAAASDFTGKVAKSQTAPIPIAFGGTKGNLYDPKCIKVTDGTKITFVGTFSSHPLVGGAVRSAAKRPALTGPLVGKVSTGSSKDFTISGTAAYPYYCDVHALSKTGMKGAVIVLP